ncbi:carboxymuconolactone decarboxylase family protein [Veronia pacifica]|uniref:Carboxymuconolactone decarboxylase n=1 Tax=Veronia pacifica TaxID=1080227 RepID=A0A1C3EPF1_9GAMM|nr:carboxymuconolactone decarboxylase family protein [Veronia pacifica]ODA35124.1 carboxymuconolactone decarboxylase [Veronia pacifica]
MQKDRISELLSPISDEEWPAEIESLLPCFAGKLNVYRTMAHHPNLLTAWSNLREHIVVKNALGTQRSEVVILRAGVNLLSEYEWSHHVSRARICGMSDSRIASLKEDPSRMLEEDRILATAVDELFSDKKLSENTASQLFELVGKEGILDVIATVGFYSSLGYILNTFDVPIDEYIAKEMEKKPLLNM